MSHFFSATEAWMAALKRVRNAREMSTRGYVCRETIGAHLSFDMTNCLVNHAKRKLFFRFAFAEAYWILSGSDRVVDICDVNPKLARFSDDGVVFAGAYGPAWASQKARVLNALIDDGGTRQAVVSFWRNLNPAKSKDVPCSTTAQWFIRHGAIHCVYTMRSNDLWLGFPYDVFSFTCMTMWLALELRYRGISVKLGSMFHRAGSLHLYETDLAKANQCVLAFEPAFNRGQSANFALPAFDDGAEFMAHLLRMRNKDASDGKWLAPSMQQLWTV